MPELLRRYPLIVLLAGLAAALVVVLGIETGWGAAFRPDIASTKPRPSPPFEAKLLPSVVAQAPEQAYPETANRPLFTPTRRPAPTSTAGATTMQKGLFTLQGVIIAGDTKIAMLREKSTGKIHRAEKGKTVGNGITVAEVDREKVTLTQGGDQEVLDLLVQKGAAAPQQHPGAPAPAPAAAQAGPFGSATPAPAPGMPPAVAQPTPIPPAAAAQPAQPAQGGADFGPHPPGANPAARTTPQQQSEATQPGAVLTPEELLARRRARRAQQLNQ